MIIFIAGLSKAGKTSRCMHSISQISTLHYVSVSKLLRSKGVIFPIKTLECGVENQRLAYKEIKKINLIEGRHMIIDGHSLIETLEGPLLVPDWFYTKVSPDLIVFIEDDPEAIIERRNKHEQSNVNKVQIEALQSMAISACRRVASILRIELKILHSPNLERFSREIHKIIQS